MHPFPSSKDNCENAQSVGDVKDQPFETTGATFDGPGLCMISPNIWYCYTVSCTGDVTVSLAGSSFDTMLAVYEGCECYPALDDLVGCNDDAGTDEDGINNISPLADAPNRDQDDGVINLYDLSELVADWLQSCP